MGLWSRIVGEKGPELVRVGIAGHEPEAELMLSLLRGAEIPAMTQRTRGFELPDYLAAGRRDIMVPAHLEAQAREVLQPLLDAAGVPETGEQLPDSGDAAP